jgi:DNA repair photolyase
MFWAAIYDMISIEKYACISCEINEILSKETSMIISASRRCDIPAFYSTWFMRRISQGYVYVRNPVNAYQISKVSLKQEDVDCIVFWTKNAAPLISQLEKLDEKGYSYYFLWTINLYEKDLEPYLPPKKQIIESFQSLSAKIGSDKVILRYDPIIINKKYTLDYHIDQFEKLLSQLAGYTGRCIISFVDIYDKMSRAAKETIGPNADDEIKFALAQEFSKIAKKQSVILQTCAEEIDLSSLGIDQGACIDKKLIEKLLDCSIQVKKAKSQRSLCGCIESRDIGAYDCCGYECIYCYANASHQRVAENMKKHDADSPLLIGQVKSEDRICESNSGSLINRQCPMFEQ